jgi:hypothetical protein
MKKGQFGEPWYVKQAIIQRREGDNERCVGSINNDLYQDRACDCVNALDGLNPEALQGLIEAVEKMAACERITCDNDCDNYVCCETRNLKRALDALKQEETNA